ncbi:MAG: M48 family metallopeptidase [Hoylesella enoeca]|uniref:M48 family metallopeptidase n=1 Tax=Hoylesella enoeca TaxID=76123 RepID=UPI003F9EED59
MKYVGMQTQIQRNNQFSLLLLLLFPVIILATVWAFLALIDFAGVSYYNEYGEAVHKLDVQVVNSYFLTAIPWVIGGVLLWFIIAFFTNTAMIRQATGARPLSRKENPRVYNIIENLCMTCNMDMPKINVVDDPQLNAFASGIDKNSYTVTVTTGLLDLLTDEELAGVLGHELTHIRNHDTRLLITSIIFVGIVSTVMSLIVRILYNMFIFGGGNRRSNSKSGNNGAGIIVVMLIGLVCCAVAYFFTLLTRFAISRRREYMADAGGAELCGNPLALASALRKISRDPGLDQVGREDVAQLFIIHPDEISTGLLGFMDSLFSTHPDTERRIEILEQF